MYILFFWLLALALVASLFRTESARQWLAWFRSAVIISCLSFFSWQFLRSSVDRNPAEALAVQLINKLPQTLDFYLILQHGKTEMLEHPGKIRPEHFRLEKLDAAMVKNFSIAATLGQNLVYYSHHPIANKNMDVMLEIDNYTIENQKAADVALEGIKKFQEEQIRHGIWASLDFLLLFLNIVLLVRRWNTR